MARDEQAQIELIEGDVLEVLGDMPDESVQCVITSPPYWGLRDYGVDGMIGLEPTLEGHIAKLVAVFAEVRRVLRSDGTFWLNYGDAYQTSPPGNKPGAYASSGLTNPKRQEASAYKAMHGRTKVSGLAQKQRLLMPARVALALQADGWWVRSEIVWAKSVAFCPTYTGSCMPSSVRDRPTDSHEMLYLLTKAPRYFYDGEAIREPGVFPAGTKAAKGSAKRKAEDGVNARPAEYATYSGTRNVRTVWTINPQPLKGVHFATFPEALVEPCLKAGTSERGACSECGAPWQRVIKVSYDAQGRTTNGPRSESQRHETPGFKVRLVKSTKTTGWEPTCEHTDAPTVPCTVLDPFCGSGTVGVVALRHGRSFIGIDLNGEYLDFAEKRIGLEETTLDLIPRIRWLGRKWAWDDEEGLTQKAVRARLKPLGLTGKAAQRVLDAAKARAPSSS